MNEKSPFSYWTSIVCDITNVKYNIINMNTNIYIYIYLINIIKYKEYENIKCNTCEMNWKIWNTRKIFALLYWVPRNKGLLFKLFTYQVTNQDDLITFI